MSRVPTTSEALVVAGQSLVFDTWGSAATRASAHAALGLGSMALQDSREVEITGGFGVLDVLRVNRMPTEPTDAVPLAYARSALSTSGYPFTQKGDLLVHRYPDVQEQVVHLPPGADGRVFRSDFQWVTAPVSPTGPQIVDYVVCIGPTECVLDHDFWFPTVAEFETWHQGLTLLGSLDIMLNGYTVGLAGGPIPLTLPKLPAGTEVRFLVPESAAQSTGTATPWAFGNFQLDAAANTLTGNLTQFSAFTNVVEAAFDCDTLMVYAHAAQKLVGAQGRIGRLVLWSALASSYQPADLVDCQLDIGHIEWALAPAVTSELAVRVNNSGLQVDTAGTPTGLSTGRWVLNNSAFTGRAFGLDQFVPALFWELNSSVMTLPAIAGPGVGDSRQLGVVLYNSSLLLSYYGFTDTGPTVMVSASSGSVLRAGLTSSSDDLTGLLSPRYAYGLSERQFPAATVANVQRVKATDDSAVIVHEKQSLALAAPLEVSYTGPWFTSSLLQTAATVDTEEPVAAPPPPPPASTGITLVMHNGTNTLTYMSEYLADYPAIVPKDVGTFDTTTASPLASFTDGNNTVAFSGVGSTITVGNVGNTDQTYVWEFHINTTDITKVGYFVQAFGPPFNNTDSEGGPLSNSYKSNTGAITTYGSIGATSGPPYTQGDIIGVVYDSLNARMQFYKNGIPVAGGENGVVTHSGGPMASRASAL